MVFCCVSYLHIDTADKSKSDVKSFLGYGGTKIDYIFWDDQNKKISRSKNMIFNEGVLYKDKTKVDSRST